MTVLVNGDRVYAVTDVIKVKQSFINEDCEDENQPNDEDADRTRRDTVVYSTVSRKMIEQFFTKVEGPDHDWQDEYYDVFSDIDRLELIISSPDRQTIPKESFSVI